MDTARSPCTWARDSKATTKPTRSSARSSKLRPCTGSRCTSRPTVRRSPRTRGGRFASSSDIRRCASPATSHTGTPVSSWFTATGTRSSMRCSPSSIGSDSCTVASARPVRSRWMSATRADQPYVAHFFEIWSRVFEAFLRNARSGRADRLRPRTSVAHELLRPPAHDARGSDGRSGRPVGPGVRAVRLGRGGV